MEIEFYLNQRLDEKKNAGGEVRTWHSPITNWPPRKHGHQGLTFHLRIFDEVLQLSSSSKFAKVELYRGGHMFWATQKLIYQRVFKKESFKTMK